MSSLNLDRNRSPVAYIKRLEKRIKALELAAANQRFRSWTPAIDGTWVLNNGTTAGRYILLGDSCFFMALITWGTTTTFGGGRPQVSLPFAVHTDFDQHVTHARLREAGVGNNAGIAIYTRALDPDGMEIWARSADEGRWSSVFSTHPFTWAGGDQIFVSGFYRIEGR